jgi:predicted metal-binding protein
MKSYSKFIKKAVALGADDAKIIKTDTIVTGPWVRWKCRYGCDGYNSSLCCPPNTPDYRETRELVDSYKTALLAHFTSDLGTRPDPTDIVVTLERDIFLAGYFKAFALGAGPCQLCAECSMDVCRHADKARPSMESCGIDVFRTAKNNGYKIEVLKDYSCRMNRFGLVLIE